METRCLFLELLLLSIHCACAQGFVLRKRSWRDQDSHLAEALRVIEGQRRRLEEPRGNYYADMKDSVIWDPEMSAGDMSDAGDGAFLRELFSNPRDEYGYRGEDERADTYGDGGGGADIADFLAEEVREPGQSVRSKRVSVDESELEDIFADSNTQKRSTKKREDEEWGPEKREYDPSESLKEARNKKDASSVVQVGLNPAVVNQLLASVQQTAADKVDKTPATVRVVSQDEVSDLLGEGEGKDGTEEDEKENKDEEVEDESEGLDSEEDLVETEKEGEGAENKVEDVEDDQNKEIFPEGGEDDSGGETTVKRKRSGITEQDIDEVVADNGRDVLTIVKAYLDLEDEENDNLANALNLATRSQTERTNKYIPEEVDYLKHAIRDEQNIKALKSMLKNPGGVEQEDEDDEEEEETPYDKSNISDEEEDVELIGKRAYTKALDISPADLGRLEQEERKVAENTPNDIITDVIDDGDDVSSIEAAADKILASMSGEELRARIENAKEKVDSYLSQKLKDFLYRTVMTDLESDEIVEAPLGEPLSADENQMVQEPSDNWLDEGGELGGQHQADDWYLNPFLRELYQQYQARKQDVDKRGLVPEVDSAGIFGPLADTDNDIASITEADVCPAVQDYTDDCNIAMRLGLGLDREATDLCNRHQLCYRCGGAHAISEDACDRGYLAEAERLCGSDTECKDDAAGLYLLMVDHHQPAAGGATECASQCVYDYIVGLAGPENRK